MITENTYLQDVARWEVLGAPSGTVVKQSDGTPIVTTSFSWGVLTSGTSDVTERRFPHLASQVVSRYEVGGTYNGSLISTTTTSDSIDATSGLVYDSKTTVLEASSANGLQPGGLYTQRTYHPLAKLNNDTAGWCLGSPGQTQHISSHSQSGGTAITQTTDRTWDQTIGQARSERRGAGQEGLQHRGEDRDPSRGRIGYPMA